MNKNNFLNKMNLTKIIKIILKHKTLIFLIKKILIKKTLFLFK
jgi:hypothetical protein